MWGLAGRELEVFVSPSEPEENNHTFVFLFSDASEQPPSFLISLP